MRAIEPAHDRHWFDIYGRVARTGEPVDFEDDAAPFDRWWNVQAFRVGDAAPGLVGVLFTDITRRRRDELALHESRERFRVFAQAVPDPIWATAPDGTPEWVNDQARLYTGTGANDPLAGAWDAWVHGRLVRDRAAAASRRRHVARAIAIRNEAGEVVRWIGASTDIHDQKEAAAALANPNDTLELLVAERTRERDRVWNSTDDLIGTVGVDGFLKHVNPPGRACSTCPRRSCGGCPSTSASIPPTARPLRRRSGGWPRASRAW